ncbi:2-dehydro-3-deoxygalactonokinase [Aquincola sp. J276]|uniref:2-dehydro-3-deoxygalactonokinase n=1 Tax=Aquincola sp. J276 TaxID=2898432 RepID=UPI0021513FB2|nr:2-dehydro-3-deoxygalactonokinase [Aquincola sp. J276]MCR5867285.1 2-dehydro-3-deoxygalactonokinase [Aquincola sp. J276]
MTHTQPTADLLALDWGTSNLRAYALAADGRMLAERSSARGIAQLAQPGDAGFEQALDEIAGDWLRARPGLPMVACGMVGSAQGWREAAYVPCPADVQRLADQACRVATAHGPLLIAPGLLHAPADAPPDVMRGEEIQIAGALAALPAAGLDADEAWLLLPGTHAKWAQVRHGRVLGFATYMTGELYAVLRKHSLLGRTMPAETDGPVASDEAAFAAGVAQARQAGPGDLPHQLFATRTLGLTGRLGPQAQADYLSGLLIGHELVSGLARLQGRPPLVLVGEPALLQRYAGALHALGQAPAALLGNSAPQGLLQFACAAGLLAGHVPTLKAVP